MTCPCGHWYNEHWSLLQWPVFVIVLIYMEVLVTNTSYVMLLIYVVVLVTMTSSVIVLIYVEVLVTMTGYVYWQIIVFEFWNCSGMSRSLNVFIKYNGHWDHSWRYVDCEMKGILVPTNTTYIGLLELVRNVLGIRMLNLGKLLSRYSLTTMLISTWI